MPSNIQQVLLGFGSRPDASIAFLQDTVDGTNQSTYTFSSQNFGTADSARYIIVAFTGRSSDGAARTITSVTIGGVSASAASDGTPAVQHSNGNTAAIYYAAVPTGTSGDVVIVMSSTMARLNIGLYRALNINPTAEDTGISTADPLTSDLTVSAGSIQLAVAHTDGTATATWSGTNGLTEDWDSLQGDAAARYSGASRSSPSAVTVTATCTWTTSTRPVYAAASFARA